MKLQIAGQGLGQGFLGRFRLQPLGQAAAGLVGQMAGGGLVALGLLVQGADQRRLEQREAVVLRPSGGGQGLLGVLARHGVLQ